jgi:hypothetical protein
MGLLGGGDKIVDIAEVDLAGDLGLAIDALAIAGVVVGVAADVFGVRLGILRSYNYPRNKSREKCCEGIPGGGY